MKTFSLITTSALTLLIGAGTAHAQSATDIVKLGIIRYNTHSQTSGITGVGIPPGADAKVGSANTLLFTYEHLFTDKVGIELVLGVPPTIKSRATGSVAFLGDNVLEAKNIAPTALVVYHFGEAGDTWRPYAGAGVNYTHFGSPKTSIPGTTPKLSDSVGVAGEVGIDYAFNAQFGLFASFGAAQVKSKLVATGSTVLKTTIDFRPTTYSFGASYRF
ncbi:MAG: OmpW family protein [Leptothrix sp. (in: b-proteobacteria)]